METNFKKPAFLFWYQWLMGSSIFFMLIGIMGAFYGNNFLFRPYNKMIAKTLWHSSQFPAEAEQFRAFIYGSLGGTITCCYILLIFITRYAFKEKQRWARNAILTAFSIWFIIDSSVCLYFHVYFQVYIINTFSLIIKILPIIFTWTDFKKTENTSL